MRSVNSHTIKETLFLSQRTREDAGAVLFECCTQNNRYISVVDNRFVHCECYEGEGSSGGAIEAWTDSCPHFSNCLFSQCKATIGGGALWLLPPYPSPTVSFCFFCYNQGSDFAGHDITFDGTPSSSPLLLCFSTCEGKSVGRHVTEADYSDWLPSSYILVSELSENKTKQSNLPQRKTCDDKCSLQSHILGFPLFRPHRENKTIFHFF